MDIELTMKLMASSFKDLQKKRSSLEEKLLDLYKQKHKVQNEDIPMIELSKSYYTNYCDYVYKESVNLLSSIINKGLATIFYDSPKGFIFKLEISDRYGKSCNLLINDKPLDKSEGQGLKLVVTTLFIIYFLLKKGKKPILFMDEKITVLSSCYRTGYFEFLRSLPDVKLAHISHDQSLNQYFEKNMVVE